MDYEDMVIEKRIAAMLERFHRLARWQQRQVLIILELWVFRERLELAYTAAREWLTDLPARYAGWMMRQ